MVLYICLLKRVTFILISSPLLKGFLRYRLSNITHINHYFEIEPFAMIYLQQLLHTTCFSFQNVLRELEQKKPQLDELVKTAENLRESPIRQHIPDKGN